MKNDVIPNYEKTTRGTWKIQEIDTLPSEATFVVPDVFSDEPELDIEVIKKVIEQAGYCVTSTLHILAAACVAMKIAGSELPEDEKNKAKSISQKQGFTLGILNGISMNVDQEDKSVRYYLNDKDITKDVEELVSQEKDRLVGMSNHPAWQTALRLFIPSVIEEYKGKAHLALIDRTKQYSIPDSPLIAMVGLSSRDTVKLQRCTDKVIVVKGNESDQNSTNSFAILRESISFAKIEARRSKLRSQLEKGEIDLEPQFSLQDWPQDPLMNHTKKEVQQYVADFLSKEGRMCDPLDLQYQILFRLTTFPVDQVFQNGGELESYLNKTGAYTDWHNILQLDPDLVGQFKLNNQLLEKLLEEQYMIIRERIDSTNLPYEFILSREGIFGESYIDADGKETSQWSLKKTNGKILAIKEKGDDRIGQELPKTLELTFREVDPELAREFHRVFHYIHTPRAERAYGLFLPGEELPFSILAFDKINRDYKQNMLLMHGFDPRFCWDLARLYSRPGTPVNTSSTIFSLAFADIRQRNPEIQSILSAFMPSYAHGLSMISGGFDYGSLIKPGGHTFVERTIDGKTVYEHLTARRQEGRVKAKKIRSVWPLLPVMELMAPMQKPRFEPFPEVKGKMVEVGSK